jgi:hypothetical protein
MCDNDYDDDDVYDNIDEVVCELGKYSSLHVCKVEIDDKKDEIDNIPEYETLLNLSVKAEEMWLL